MIWELQDSYNTQLKKPLLGEALFKFPNKNGVHVLVKSVKGIVGKVITMIYDIKPSGAEFIAAGGLTPKIHLYFQREGDDMYSNATTQWYRWYSNPGWNVLASGTKQILTARLQPDNWQSVGGKMGSENPFAFEDAKRNAVWFGCVFGDDRGMAHGVWVDKVGFKFKLNKFTVL